MLRLCGNRWAPIYLLSGCTLARHVLAFMIMGVDGYCSYSALVSYAVVIYILSSLSVGYWPFDFRFHAFPLLVVMQAVIRCFTGFFCDMLYSVSPFVCCEWYLTLRLGDWRVRDFLLRTDTLSPTRLVMHWRFIRMIVFLLMNVTWSSVDAPFALLCYRGHTSPPVKHLNYTGWGFFYDSGRVSRLHVLLLPPPLPPQKK